MKKIGNDSGNTAFLLCSPSLDLPNSMYTRQSHLCNATPHPHFPDIVDAGFEIRWGCIVKTDTVIEIFNRKKLSTEK